MPTHRMLLIAAFVCFAIAVLPLPLKVNLTALGLALLTLGAILGGGPIVPP
jgi:hypothetical protein